jgi:LPPG:FO 2-phospho-L-lactate transferase
MNVVALAGGVGGAKLAHGLAMVLPPESLTVVVNTGDDFEHLGFHISPDVDTVMYTLAGLANPETGWGLAGETWSFLDALGRLGGDTWFRLGDRDLATHVERRRRLESGQSLTEVTQALCAALGVRAGVLPMSDDRLRTVVQTDEGELWFQEYFVRRQCRPRVTGFLFDGEGQARPTPKVAQALAGADLVVFCPSNPFVSLGPILRLPGVRDWVRARRAVAVSPIVGGQALKGPAGKMLAELGLEVSAVGVARYYEGLLRYFVLDSLDAPLEAELKDQGLSVLVTDTIMRGDADGARLARQVLDFAGAGSG